jgi:hypothetical protein
MGEGFKEKCDRLRTELLAIEKGARSLRFDSGLMSATNNLGECQEQAMLAVRAIEDARMRLGKVLQHADGGVSIYDKGAK